VVDRQILTQLVTVLLADQRKMTFPAEEIQVLADKPPVEAKPPPVVSDRGSTDEPSEATGETRERRGRGRRFGAGDTARKAAQPALEDVRADSKDCLGTAEPPAPPDDSTQGNADMTEAPDTAPPEAQTPSAPAVGAGQTGGNESRGPRGPRGRRRRRHRRGGNSAGNVR
jgi:hypothetical protein